MTISEHTESPETASPQRQVRMRTVAFGIVMLVVALTSLVAVLTSWQLDLGTVVLSLMIGCGVLLIAGARRQQ